MTNILRVSILGLISWAFRQTKQQQNWEMTNILRVSILGLISWAFRQTKQQQNWEMSKKFVIAASTSKYLHSDWLTRPSILHSVTLKNKNIWLPNYLLHLPTTNKIFLTTT